METNLGQLLTKRAHLSPELEAYVGSHDDERLSYAELNARCNKIANALLGAGVSRGDRVALLLENGSEFIETYYAVAKIGAVVVPLNWRLVAEELRFILGNSGAAILLFSSAFRGTVDELYADQSELEIERWVQLSADADAEDHFLDYHKFRRSGSSDEPPLGASKSDVVSIMYTSGTTGLPKGVVHTHETSIWSAICMASNLYYYEDDRYLVTVPMFHAGALAPLSVNVYRGATSVVMRAFDPELAWRLIERESITIGFLVPSMLNFMLQVPDSAVSKNPASVRWFFTGAAPVPVWLTNTYHEMGITLLQIYGMTESGGPACLMDREHAIELPDSTGKPFFFTSIKIVDDDGKTLPAGVSGEICISGRHVMQGYWKNPESTAETVKEGWLHSGDIGMQDEKGNLYVQDRKKDMIISGGENVFPAEIENILVSHPDVIEAAVIGQPSEKWGESPIAIVSRANDELSPSQLKDFCRQKLAGYKQPKEIVFVETIPRNPSGKILKRVLRDQFPGPAPE